MSEIFKNDSLSGDAKQNGQKFPTFQRLGGPTCCPLGSHNQCCAEPVCFDRFRVFFRRTSVAEPVFFWPVFFSPFPAPAPIKNRLSTITHFLQHPTFLTRKNPLFLSILYFNYCSLKSMLKPTKRISLRIFSVLSIRWSRSQTFTQARLRISHLPVSYLPSPCLPVFRLSFQTKFLTRPILYFVRTNLRVHKGSGGKNSE